MTYKFKYLNKVRVTDPESFYEGATGTITEAYQNMSGPISYRIELDIGPGSITESEPSLALIEETLKAEVNPETYAIEKYKWVTAKGQFEKVEDET